MGCEVVYLCRKWLKVSANGLKTPDVYSFLWLLLLKRQEMNPVYEEPAGMGACSLSAWHVLPTIAYSTFQSFNGLNHIKNARINWLQAMLIRRENYLEENMYEQST